MTKKIGILTAGGDSPGLNAAIRSIGKSLLGATDYDIVGFLDGFRGLINNNFMQLDRSILSNIVSLGGTMLGTSRDKPHKILVNNKKVDMRDTIVQNYNKHNLEALICIGGGGTQKNALKLVEKDLNIITLPKTIDNDIYFTDTSIGFDTALEIATSAIDRLHTTAHSHHRIIFVETMGHKAGWLALGAGIAGGAEVILIPEIPYIIENIADSILYRYKKGKSFSIVAIAEGAMSVENQNQINSLQKLKDNTQDKEEINNINKDIKRFRTSLSDNTMKLASQLEEITKLESRVTILGHLQRGGAPSATDRMLATRLGVAATNQLIKKNYNNMISVQANILQPIPLKNIAGKTKHVPLSHQWIETARKLGICLGDKKLNF